MPFKHLHSPRVDTQNVVNASINVSVATASILATILGTMKALSESHRVLENLLIRAYQKSQTLPLSTDEKLSVLFLILLLVYCLVIYPFFICPTANIPGSYLASTPLGFLIHSNHKTQDNADQWALELHQCYGPVVRLTPTLVSVNDSSLVSRCSTTGTTTQSSQSSSTRSKISVSSSFSAATSATNLTTSTSTPSSETRTGDSHLFPFSSTISAVVDDIRLAMRGQKTINVHELLSRHLQDQAPASFALALAHTIYQLSHPLHRHYFNRLARQLAADDPDDYSEISGSAKLLDAVVKESLRMQQAPNHHSYSIVTPEDGVRVADHYLPGAVGIHISLYAVSRNSSIFTRPNDFNPERWLGKEASSAMDEALEFVLNYQRNLKPGFDITLNCLKLLLATMLREFDMKLPLGQQLKQLDLIALKSGGCRVRFRERKQVVEKKVRFAEHIVM